MSSRLGVRQKHMLAFARKYPGIHYMDSKTKSIALSLERRNLITIGKECGEWYFEAKEV